MRIFALEEVPHIMIELIILGNLEFWLMWAVEDNIISILDVVGH